jgi:hypothetical protein
MELLMKKLYSILFILLFIFRFEIFPQGVTYSQGPVLNDARTGATGGVLSDGRVVIIGGHGTGFVKLNTAEIWNPSTSTFSLLTMNDYRDYAGVIPLNDGRALIAGGMSSNLGVGQLATMEIFDPANNTFTAVASMTHIRTYNRGTQLGSGKVLIVGSWYEPTSASIGDLYDPSNNICIETGSMVTPRANAFVLPMRDGTALVLGGTGTYGGTSYESIEKYDPGTNSFSLFQNTLLPKDTLWFALYSGSDLPETFQMSNGKYIMLATKADGNKSTYKLFTIDPNTKIIDTLATNPPLPYYDGLSGDSTSYLSPILDKSNNKLYLVSVKGENGGGMIKISTVDLTTHQLYLSSGLIQIPYYFWDSPKLLLKDKRIFVAGGFSTDNFDPVNSTFLLTLEPLGVKDDNNVPVEFSLQQNYPNPFNPSTIIRYSIPKDGFVSIDVYNILGEKVASLFNGNMKAGKSETEFNASKLASGIYICRMQAGSFSSSIKMILQK